MLYLFDESTTWLYLSVGTISRSSINLYPSFMLVAKTEQPTKNPVKLTFATPY